MSSSMLRIMAPMIALNGQFPTTTHADSLSSYRSHEDAIDCIDLQFSANPSPISLFKSNNPSIGIHLLAYGNKNRCFSILYLWSNIHQHTHKITLLLPNLPDNNKTNKDYVWVKNLFRLISPNYSSNGAHYECLFCLPAFTLKCTLDDHEEFIVYCIICNSVDIHWPPSQTCDLMHTIMSFHLNSIWWQVLSAFSY